MLILIFIRKVNNADPRQELSKYYLLPPMIISLRILKGLIASSKTRIFMRLDGVKKRLSESLVTLFFFYFLSYDFIRSQGGLFRSAKWKNGK